MIHPPTAHPVHPLRRWGPVPAPSCPTSDPVLLLRPPYGPEDLQPARPDLRAAADLPGTVVAVPIRRADADAGALRARVRELALRAPSCPVVVLVPAAPEEGLRVAARLAPLQLRAVVPEGPLMRTGLRDALTDRETLPRQVVDRLRLRGLRLNSGVSDLLECCFAEAADYPDLSSLLEAHRLSPSTARFRMRKKRLPSPGRWFHLARGIHAVLRLQAEPQASLAAVARELGLADHSALVHLLRRSLGVRAREIRGTLGWEWPLHRWLGARGL